MKFYTSKLTFCERTQLVVRHEDVCKRDFRHVDGILGVNLYKCYVVDWIPQCNCNITYSLLSQKEVYQPPQLHTFPLHFIELFTNQHSTSTFKSARNLALNVPWTGTILSGLKGHSSYVILLNDKIQNEIFCQRLLETIRRFNVHPICSIWKTFCGRCKPEFLVWKKSHKVDQRVTNSFYSFFPFAHFPILVDGITVYYSIIQFI